MSEAQRFGRYTVTGKLGSGAMGDVYAAVDDVLGRPVAVKTLRGGASGLAARILDERFRIEARAIATLNHPGIVQVYDIDLAADPPYLVMERVAGPSLRERFDAGPLPVHELRALGIQIARALATAHTAGIVHRDVKPGNILVAGDGVWKLADFGVAHVPESELTMTGQFVGSPAYAPPEALVRGQTTTAGDVFGLGATLYYGACGRWPRADGTRRGLLAPLPSIRELAPQLPAELVAIIDRAVAIEPERRPTAAELAQALAGGSTMANAAPALETQFVPDNDGTLKGPGVPRVPTPTPTRRAPTPLPQRSTQFVADSLPGIPVITRKSRAPLWIGLALALVVVVVLASTLRSHSAGSGAIAQPGSGSGSAAPGSAAPGSAAPGSAAPGAAASGSGSSGDATISDAPSHSPEDATDELELPPPGELRVFPPPLNSRDADDDWNDIVEALYEHKFRGARSRLDKWERKWGDTKETRHLRRQLDRMHSSRGD